MGLKGAVVAVVGDPAVAERLRRALLKEGAVFGGDEPVVEYIFHVCSPKARFSDGEVARLLERADASGGRLRHICVVRDPAAPAPATPEEVQPVALEDGLRYVAGLHGVPLAVLAAPLDPPAPGLEARALRAALERLEGTFEAGRDA
jgi:hypothetical protein